MENLGDLDYPPSMGSDLHFGNNILKYIVHTCEFIIQHTYNKYIDNRYVI